MSSNPTPKSIWVGRILSVILCLPFLGGGIYSFSGSPEASAGFEHFGWPVSLLPLIAGLEIACAILYLIPFTAFFGAILLTAYLGGAIATHLRVGEYGVWLQVTLGILVWVALYLRDPRVRPATRIQI